MRLFSVLAMGVVFAALACVLLAMLGVRGAAPWTLAIVIAAGAAMLLNAPALRAWRRARALSGAASTKQWESKR